jgi:Holliday junction resolvase RusA-like endonuclease
MTSYFFTVIGPPIAKARPRADPRSGRFYYHDSQLEAKELIQGKFLESVAPGQPDVDGKSHFKIECWFYTRTRRKIDIDNMEKMVWDSLTGVLYRDDSQIWDAEAHRRVDPELPRTEVIVTVTEE